MGEVTLWPSDNGGTFTKVRRLLPAPSYPSDEVIWWDSQQEDQQGQQNMQGQNMQSQNMQGQQYGHTQTSYR